MFTLYRNSGELLFVNLSAGQLDWVTNTSFGLIGTDTGAVSTSAFDVRYDEVKPGEAVKIDEFDDFYDLDELIVSTVTVSSSSHGLLSFQVAKKGGQGSLVLLWEDGFVSPHCTMTVQSR